MGEYSSTSDNIVQEATPIDGAWSSPAYFNGSTFYYITDSYGSTTGNYADQFSIADGSIRHNPPRRPRPTLRVSRFDAHHLPTGRPTASSGCSTRRANELRAYNANNLSDELYTSAQAANGRDTLGTRLKFTHRRSPTARFSSGTSDSLVAYGLLPTPGNPTLPRRRDSRPRPRRQHRSTCLERGARIGERDRLHDQGVDRRRGLRPRRHGERIGDECDHHGTDREHALHLLFAATTPAGRFARVGDSQRHHARRGNIAVPARANRSRRHGDRPQRR